MMNLFVYTISAQQKELLAVLIFRNNSTTSSYTSRYYPEELCGILTTEFFNTNKFRLIERPRINEVIHEQRFQESNLSNRQIQSLGQILGVRKIITGECVFRSGTYSANVRMVDVQTGSIDISGSCTVNDTINMGYFVLNLNEREMMQYLAEYVAESILGSS
jgi:TolB-like protein